MNLYEHRPIDKYCASKSTVPSKVCDELYQYTHANVPIPQMAIGDLEGSFLGFLVELVGATNVLEVGTYTGYSALSMAERLPENGNITTLDVNEETTQVAKDHWAKSPHGKKITSILGPAEETFKKFIEEKRQFDLIFIDADKEGYQTYFDLGLGLLTKTGCFAVDNCLWNARVLEDDVDGETQAIKDFNDNIASRSDLTKVLLPVRDGLFLIRPARA